MLSPEQVLSVVGQQVMTIQQALKSDNPRISFMGSDIIVKPGFGVFITMNPGYAGRYESCPDVHPLSLLLSPPLSVHRFPKDLLKKNDRTQQNRCEVQVYIRFVNSPYLATITPLDLFAVERVKWSTANSSVPNTSGTFPPPLPAEKTLHKRRSTLQKLDHLNTPSQLSNRAKTLTPKYVWLSSFPHCCPPLLKLKDRTFQTLSRRSSGRWR